MSDTVADGVLWDEDAETRVLGSCLLAGRLIGVAAAQLAPTDFVRPSHRWLFDVLMELHRSGQSDPHPVQGVLNEIKLRGPDAPTRSDVLALEANAPGTSERPFAAAVGQVLRYSIARQVALAGGEIRERAKTAADDPGDLIDFAAELLARVVVPVTNVDQVENLSTVDDFLDATTAKPTRWVIPGLLRHQWRCLMVASEGAGKSTAARQLAICAAQGISPFALAPIPPVRTLIVDLENPDDAIADGCRPIVTRAKLAAQDYEPGRAWLWRQVGGINLRTRVGRGQLEAVVAATRPDLLCLGPVYKAYRVDKGESDEIAAGEVMGVFDDLRTRYDFALVLEHHAPKAQGGSRDLLPYGSSLWLRWPELGVKLVRDLERRDGSVKVERFRQDRVDNGWPDRLDRGGTMPWTGWWENPVEATA